MLQPAVQEGRIGRLRLFRSMSRLWVQNGNWNSFHAVVEEARTAHSSHGLGARLRLPLPLTTSSFSRSSLGLSVAGGLGATRARERRVSKSMVVNKGTEREENGKK